MSDNRPDHALLRQSTPGLPVVNGESLSNTPSTNGLATFPTVIWTPRFIMLFVSLFMLGLCVASIVIQLWLNNLIKAETILLLYTTLAMGSSLFVIYKARNPWIRAGAFLASIWCVLIGLHFALPLVSRLDPHTSLVMHLDVATASAFLGMAVCFSIAYTPLRRWDNWFFCLLPFIGVVIVVLNVLLTPSDLPTSSFDESMVITALLFLGTIIWWFRPINWNVQPAVAFFLGAIPLLQLLFTGSGYHRNGISFFMTQVLLLFFFLVNVRLLQGERHLFK